MKIYLICPVRGVTEEQQREIDDYANSLTQQGHGVHNPKYAVDQNDETGFEICLRHSIAMRDADRVDVFWDVTSRGSHFDLGMAFAMGRDVKLVRTYQEDNPGKSYVKVMQQMRPTDSHTTSVLNAIGIESFALTEEQKDMLWILVRGLSR